MCYSKLIPCPVKQVHHYHRIDTAAYSEQYFIIGVEQAMVVDVLLKGRQHGANIGCYFSDYLLTGKAIELNHLKLENPA